MRETGNIGRGALRGARRNLALALFGLILAPSAQAQAQAQDGGVHSVPLFPAASDGIRQGFVRVINHSQRAGEVTIEAIDDESHRFGPISLAMDADETVHFNSADLEEGNASKGLSGGVGQPAAGDWRLRLSSGLDIEVLSYIRTPADGFLTPMHDLVPQEDDGRHRVATFNPGSNRDHASRLRLINPGARAAQVTITGIDGNGASPGGEVRLTLPAGTARTIGAGELENGGLGLGGALGDGAGKWQLTVESDREIHAMSLLLSPTGHMTNLSTALGNVEEGVHTVPMFPAVSDPRGRQGFVRVINRSAESGEVTIGAFDDTDRDFGTSRLALGANETVHFNSDDLQMGNVAKGLTGGTGAGEGDWRLTLESTLDLEVLAYVRTRGGFLTAMHDTIPRDGGRHRVATFNPASNVNQASLLRLVNAGAEAAEVEVAGTDGAGRSSHGSVMITVPAGTSRTLTAQELEAGGEGFDGRLGDGAGKWQLVVESEQSITVMSLLSSPTGHLTNLSTAPSLDYAPADGTVFDDRVVGMRLATDNEDHHSDFPTAGRFRKTVGTDVYGDYSYTRTGPNEGTLVTDYDDGDRCTAELVFRSRTAGISTFTCDGGDSGELEWWVAETPRGVGDNALVGLSTPTPWHLTNVWIDFSHAPEDIDSYCVTFSLDRDVPDDVNLYIAPFNQSINKIVFYGGIQTRIDGHVERADSAAFVRRGRGAIFSRWEERAWGAIEQAPGGLVESSGHEGNFIGVRNDFAWREGSWRLCLRKAGVVEGEPLPDDYEVEDIANGWGRFVHTWVRMEVTDLGSGATTFVGALAFPGRTISLRRSNAIFVEIYGQPSPFPVVDVPEFTLSFGKFQVDGRDLTYAVVTEFSNPIPSESANVPKLADARYDAVRGVIRIDVGRFAGEFGKIRTVH